MLSKPREAKQHYQVMQNDPTPRFRFEGDIYPYGPEAKPPYKGQAILHQNAAGYRAARREIAKVSPNHPCLNDYALWPDLAVQ